jgi:hypothetical protein
LSKDLEVALIFNGNEICGNIDEQSFLNQQVIQVVLVEQTWALNADSHKK